MESEKVKEIKKALEDLDMICYEKTCSDKINRISNYIDELENELKTCKDRIVELEDGIAKSMLGCEFLPECTNDKLKQFTEMLKKKSAYSFIFGKKFIVENDIDETLKECLKE